MPEMERSVGSEAASVRWTALVLLAAACGGPSHPAAPPAPVANAPSPADAAISYAALPAPSADGPLYRDGRPITPDRGDRYTCRPADDQLRTCRDACALVPPVGYWDPPMQCSGVALPPPDLSVEKKRLAALAIPACQCSCDAGWQAANEAARLERMRCASVP